MTRLEQIINELKKENDPCINYGVSYEQKAKNILNKELRQKEENEKNERLGLKTITYREYKNNEEYMHYPTLKNSYDKKTKTITIITKANKTNICPKCGTYCYGDCYGG